MRVLAALGLLLGGEHARGGGWLGRAHRLLEAWEHDCVERGYLLVPAGMQGMAMGELAAATATFERAAEIGDRFADPDLIAMARLGLGQALVRAQQTATALPCSTKS